MPKKETKKQRKERRRRELTRYKVNRMGEEWTPFREVSADQTKAAGFGVTAEQLGQAGVLFWNSRYHVFVREYESEVFQGRVTHLSIRRNDRKPVRDWRELQRIKNELCGPECEGVELYPAESRVVDQANQFHMWVMPPGMVVPLGFFEGRQVGSPKEAEEIGAKQRPREDENEDC